MERIRISYTLKLAAGIGVAILAGCSPSNLERPRFEEHFVLADSIMLPHSYSGGDIVSIRQLDDSTYVFADYSTRMIHKYNPSDSVVFQIGRHGEGPGEYRLPVYLRVLENAEIAFSDISNPLIKFVRSDGSYRGRLAHSHGGGRKFDLLGDTIYVQSSDEYLLYAYTREGRKLFETLPIDASYDRMISHISGGGVTAIGQKIFTVSSLEPRIYVYDASTQETETLEPSLWKRFGPNFDRARMADLTLSRWEESASDFAVFLDLDKLVTSEAAYLVALIRYREGNIVHILNLDGEVILDYQTDLWLVGSQQNVLFFVDASTFGSSAFNRDLGSTG